MALVAGVVFFVFRAGFALLPSFASRYPIKKFAAMAALAVAAFYLVLSGAAVATQRSFIMLSIVLLAVMLDRTALTLRTLAIAALAVLLIRPRPSSIRVSRCHSPPHWRWSQSTATASAGAAATRMTHCTRESHFGAREKWSL
jgi:hypothetical protein